MDSQRRAELQASQRPLEPHDPVRVGPYDLAAKLGEGGMGAVYLGRRPGAKLVAIKVVRTALASDPAFLARFRDEVVNAERVASFCTAQVLDHGEDAGRAYMVTEYIDGPSLLDYVADNGRLTPGMLHGVAVGVAAALVAIHAAGLVHRDLKPSNVLLSMSGPRVIDFGIARALDAGSSHTATGQVIGSAGWIAPEQILNQGITPAVDVFAWGCLVAFAGNGQNPYGTGNFQVMAARVVHAEPDLGVLPGPLAGLVRRAMDKDPARRPSAQELLLALVGGVGDAAVSTTLGEAWPEPAPTVQQAATSPPVQPQVQPPVRPQVHEAAQPGAGAAPESTRPGFEVGPTVPAAGSTRSDPAVHPQQPAPQPWAPPGPAHPPVPPPKPRRGVLLAAGTAVAVLAAVGAVYLLTNGSDNPRNGERPPSGPGPLPGDAMLARMDTAPGWGKECHAKIGRLTPAATGLAQAAELIPGEGCDVLPQWSPDRSSVAFTRTAEDAPTSSVWVMRADGSGGRLVLAGIARRSRVSWSPDGRKLAVMVPAGGVNQLTMVTVEGGSTQKLTDDRVEKDDPTWSSDGRIAFWAERDGSQQIYALDGNSTGPVRPADWTQITTSAKVPDGANDPDWSPDGRWLAFTMEQADGAHDIAIVGRDGTVRRLTAGPEKDMDPNWSPNGKWLAFVRGPVPTPQIWAMPVERGGQAAQKIGQLRVGHPNWSGS